MNPGPSTLPLATGSPGEAPDVAFYSSAPAGPEALSQQKDSVAILVQDYGRQAAWGDPLPSTDGQSMGAKGVHDEATYSRGKGQLQMIRNPT